MSASPATSTAVAVTTPAWASDVYGKLEIARPVAEFLSKSDLIPKGFQGAPNNILIAGAMGARLGLDLFSSLAGISVVNGRATLWGDALLAVCQQHPEFEDYQQEVTGDGDKMSAKVTVKRKGRSPVVETFSMEDAKRAGLAGKQGPWSQYPKRMLALRARAFALRTAFADALAGFHAREEIDDEPVDVTASATVRQEPKPAKRRTVEATADAVVAAAQVETEPAPADHPEAPLPETKVEPAPAQDTSVPACQAAFGKLWKFNEDGKKAAVEILKSWKIERVAELDASDDTDRAEFLLAVSNASVRIGVPQ